jgi:hypothetical protein
LGFSCRIGLRLVTVVRRLHLGRGPVVELAVDALLVEPRHPGAGGDLEIVEAPPRSAVAGQGGRVAVQLRLEQADGGLGHGVVETVADGADEGVGADPLRLAWLPASLWQIRPARSVLRRAQAAMFKAPSTWVVCIVLAAFQPTMRREKTSTTKAT